MRTSKSRASFGMVFSTLLLVLIAQPSPAHASAESVDELIKTAMSLDAHPKRGAKTFEQYCRHCHGESGLGNAAREIPSLASQRQAYLIKQLADFAAGDRDSTDM